MERILIEGVVEHGRRLGRELGFPTANLAVPEDVAAADGVYRSRAEVGGKVYDAMSNLGRNPSVGGVERRLETHIFDFRGELYGRRLRVELLEKIRDERRFASVEELRGQIARDKEYILGLKVKEAGCREILIEPMLGSLSWAEGTLPTPYGDVNVRAEKKKDKLRIDYEAPQGVKISVNQ